MDHEHTNHVQPVENRREYLKFAAVILGITLASIVLSTAIGWSLRQFLNSFMGAFFLVFGAFKLINIEMFSLTYKGYDVVAKRFPVWGYVYPLVELFLGICYLVTDGPLWLNLATLVITGVGGVGVYNELTRTARRRHVMCACLGTFIRLPISKVSFVEDALMFVMAALMIIF